MNRLTTRHIAFMHEWLANGGNGTQAAMRTLGCSSPNCAASCASRLLRSDKVKNVLDRVTAQSGLPEKIIEVIDRSLNATLPDGSPDHRIRLRAVGVFFKLTGVLKE